MLFWTWLKLKMTKLKKSKANTLPKTTFYLKSVDSADLPTIVVDARGKAFVKDELQQAKHIMPIDETNKQIYYQVVNSYNTNNHTLNVVIQASVVDLDYNLKTVSALTCGNRLCCRQLFTNYLFQTVLTFTVLPNTLQKYEKLVLKAHIHAASGSVTVLFDVV